MNLAHQTYIVEKCENDNGNENENESKHGPSVVSLVTYVFFFQDINVVNSFKSHTRSL